MSNGDMRNGWVKLVPWAVAVSILGVVFATGAAHQRITNNTNQIDKNEVSSRSIQDALKEQAETNGRIEERTRQILNRVNELSGSIKEMRRQN